MRTALLSAACVAIGRNLHQINPVKKAQRRTLRRRLDDLGFESSSGWPWRRIGRLELGRHTGNFRFPGDRGSRRYLGRKASLATLCPLSLRIAEAPNPLE